MVNLLFYKSNEGMTGESLRRLLPFFFWGRRLDGEEAGIREVCEERG
jgi:hypothetical protein